MKIITETATVEDLNAPGLIGTSRILEFENGELQIGSVVLKPGEFRRVDKKIWVDKFAWAVTW